MTVTGISAADLAGGAVGFVLTLMVFSYLIGDNPLFRLAVHIFIGVAAAFAAAIAVSNVLWPQLVLPLVSGPRDARLALAVPAILSVFMLGAGMAAAIGGSVLGTVFPQVSATINLFDRSSLGAGGAFWVRLVEGALVLAGTLSALAYFHFSARPQPGEPAKRSSLVAGPAWLGQIFIAITLGALFAGVYAAALAALIERLRFLVEFLLPLVKPG
jgi:hypothetical protein